jgi:phosphoglycerate kinase
MIYVVSLFAIIVQYMRTLRDIEFLENVKVLLRADFNVPIENGAIVDDFRIRATLPTIDYLTKKGAKVILVSHLESADGKNLSLAPIADHINRLGVKTSFIKDIKKSYEVIETCDPKSKNGGSCFLLENLRLFEGEKANDRKFAKELASLADIFVNDAFSVCHRKHASIIGVTEFLPSYAGLQLEEEISHLSMAFNPTRPFLFVLGGAKFETKLPLLQKFIDKVDTVFVGGALVNDLLKSKGYEVGKSITSKTEVDLTDIINSPNLLLPVDIVQDKVCKAVGRLSSEDINMDIGPETLALLVEKIKSARFILWNGPLGKYESGFKEATLQFAKALGDITEKSKSYNDQEKAVSIVGGGDTLATISLLGIEREFTFVSTGGGAMLDFLAEGTLPGILALENSPKLVH